MKRFWIVFLALFVAVAAMVYQLAVTDSAASTKGGSPITMFCAASNQAVIEAIVADYKSEFDREVYINYGPSQGLLSQIEVSKTGDVFLPADDSYLKLAREKGLVREILPAAEMHAVIAVKRGNPKSIRSFDDLLRRDVRVVQANPDAAAIGKISRAALSKRELWKSIDEATAAYRGTVTEVANDIQVGSADAGIVYDAILHDYPDLAFIKIPELESAKSKVAVGIIAGSKNAKASLHFARYVTAQDRGMKQYLRRGFQTQSEEVWNDVPELNLFAGSMLRPAIEETIVEFEQREGVVVNRVYNGCGILVAQMKAGQHPDAYFACDNEFMSQVTDLFQPPVAVSNNELVILVQKGNPHNIASLRDLGREGIRVGIGHEKQCAMGWITQNTLREGGIEKEVMANVTVQSPTGDMLVNQMRTGSLDAAVAYLSNAAGSAEFLDAIQITGIKCSTATQPWAVARDSKFPNTAGRLFDCLTSPHSKEVFAAEGFQWQYDTLESKASE